MITGEHDESDPLDVIRSYVTYVMSKGHDGVSLAALYDNCDKEAINDCIASGLLIKVKEGCDLYKWLAEAEAK